jgi:hypothetical protein
MFELIQITNDPAFAQRCDALGGFRLFVDLERLGKAERQAGRNTFISAHQLDDVGRVRAVLRRSPLMVRVNPLHEGTRDEVDAVLERGADCLMLPMFEDRATLQAFADIVAGRAPIVPLLENRRRPGERRRLGRHARPAGNLRRPERPAPVAGLPLHVRAAGRRQAWNGSRGWRSGTGCALASGGIARVEEGLLPGRDVLAEHLRSGPPP